MSRDTTAQPEPEPLYGAAYMVFIYAAWVATNYVMVDAAGLAVLIGATAALTGVSLRRPDRQLPRSFAADFAVVLLFCAASLGIGVFVVHAMSLAPELSAIVVALSVVAITSARIKRRGPAFSLN